MLLSGTITVKYFTNNFIQCYNQKTQKSTMLELYNYMHYTIDNIWYIYKFLVSFKFGGSDLDDTDDHTKKANCAGKNLNDQDLDKECWVLGVA